jgi:hypothetical protein
MKIKYLLFLVILLARGGSASAHGFRFDSTVTSQGTIGKLDFIRVVNGVQFTTIAAALADLPTDPISDTGNSYKHGTIYLPFLSSGYTVSSSLTLSPFVKIVGEGMAPVQIKCVGSITCITVSNSPFTIRESDGGLYNVTMLGDGSANQTGLLGQDAFGLTLENVIFQGFYGTGSVATHLQNVSFFTERTHFSHVKWFKNKINLWLDATGSLVSFGHQSWTDLRFHIGCSAGGQPPPCAARAGPTGPVIHMTGSADLYASVITGVVNNDNTPASGTDSVFDMSGTAVVDEAVLLNFMVDNFGGGTVVGTNCGASNSFHTGGNFLGYTSNSCANVYSSIPSNGGSLDAGGLILGMYNYPPPNNGIAVSNGRGSQGLGASMFPNMGSISGFYGGFGLNGWNDGVNGFCTQGDGAHNGGAFILNQTGSTSVPPRLYIIPDAGTGKRCFSAATLDSTYFKGTLVGTGTADTLTNKTLAAPSMSAPSITSGPIAAGTAAGLTGTGACATIATQTGGSWAGSAKCTGTTGASTLTITPGTTAPNGWICSVNDETTRANLFQQTSHSATACTVTVTSVTQNDVFVFKAVAF